MSTATAPAAAGARGSSKGARVSRVDTGLLRERVSYWRSEGLSKAQIRTELRDEGFKRADIDKALRASTDDTSPRAEGDGLAGEKKPALPKRHQYAGFRKDAPEPAISEGSGFKLVPGTPAGIMLAVIAYPALLAYLTGGTTGLRAWFAAKFLNKTTTDPGGTQTAAFSLLTGTGTATAAAYSGPTSSAPLGGNGAAPSTPKSKMPALPPVVIPGLGDPPVPSAGNKGQRAATWALGQLGKPYSWGGVGPDSFDCSGLTMKAWAAAGVKIPRTTYQQILIGTRVRKADLAPGDLVFPVKGHVQIYIGGGQVVEAPRPGLKVRVSQLGAMLTARRPE